MKSHTPTRICWPLFSSLFILPVLATIHVEAGEAQRSFIHGAPESPSSAWTLAAGGRIYDNWWEAMGRPKPAGGHPSYPGAGKKSGPATWRCKECHGWDYKGKNGLYSAGSHYTGIIGIGAASGWPDEKIMTLLRAPGHGYTPDNIPDAALRRIAAFVSRGQHDTAPHIDAATGAVQGDAARGKTIYQTVCAACHGFDGRKLNWGGDKEPGYVGTESNANPWEVLHKIRNAHPGAEMINLRAFPLQSSVDVLAYAQTLPVR